MSQQPQLDVLAIGDVVTDAFIKLIDKYEHIKETENGLILEVPFGTKIPFDHAQVIEGVGNAANAAVAFSRLGLKTGLISNIGDDSWGSDMVRALKKKICPREPWKSQQLSLCSLVQRRENDTNKARRL